MGTLKTLLRMVFGAGSTNPEDEVGPQEALRRLKSAGSPQLVDVRSAEEHQQGRIAGSKLIPLPELGDRLGEIDRNKPVLLYCQSGKRSGMALRLLRERGFTQAAQISGGISAWKRDDLPVETKN